MSLRKVFVHFRWMSLELLRQPAYVVSTFAFPVLFYAIFALPESKGIQEANFLMASFSSFAVFGVVFLQFGVGTAQMKTHSWYQYLETLPVGALTLFLSRLATALFFSGLAATGVVLLAVLKTPVSLDVKQWTLFFTWLLVGGLSFCVMGLALGLLSSEKSALPVGNLIYLPLSFAGGLWKPPEVLPESLQTISGYLPTRFYGDLLWSVVKAQPLSAESLVGLGIWTLIFSLITFFALKRHQARGKV